MYSAQKKGNTISRLWGLVLLAGMFSANIYADDGHKSTSIIQASTTATPSSIDEPDSIVKLDASDSKNENGNKDGLRYQWKQINTDEENVPQVKIEKSNEKVASVKVFRPENEGNTYLYKFQVTVTDKDGNSNSSDAHVFAEHPNEHPTAQARAKPKFIYNTEQIVELNAANSQNWQGNKDGLRYQWQQINTDEENVPQVKIEKSNEKIASVKVFQPENEENAYLYKFQVTVTDKKNNQSNASDVHVLARHLIAEPTAKLNQIFQVYELNAFANPDDNELLYTWTQDKDNNPRVVRITKPSSAIAHAYIPYSKDKTSYKFAVKVMNKERNVSDEQFVTISPDPKSWQSLSTPE